MFLEKIKEFVESSVENSHVYAIPRKISIGTVSDVRIPLSWTLNLLVTIFVAIFISLSEFGVLPPKKVGFYCQDPLISHKYNGDTISPEVLGVTAIFLPVLVILATEMLNHQSFRKINYSLAWFLFKECLVGAVSILFLTSVGKVLVGEHRPHFFDVCQPDTAENCTEGAFIATFECTNMVDSADFVADASMSFPSGHSSISWFVGMYCAYVLHARLPTVNAGTLMKPFLMVLCLTWSLACSLTRITDRRHHWWDVLAGTAIGILGSLYVINLVHKKLKRIDSEADNEVTVASIEMI